MHARSWRPDEETFAFLRGPRTRALLSLARPFSSSLRGFALSFSLFVPSRGPRLHYLPQAEARKRVKNRRDNRELFSPTPPLLALSSSSPWTPRSTSLLSSALGLRQKNRLPPQGRAQAALVEQLLGLRRWRLGLEQLEQRLGRLQQRVGRRRLGGRVVFGGRQRRWCRRGELCCCLRLSLSLL